MLKKILMTIFTLALTTTSIFACWFNQENYKNAYFAGVNYFFSHYYNEGDGIDTARYINGPLTNNSNGTKSVKEYYKVNLPLTLWFKVSPRTQTINGVIHSFNIRKTELYYKIIPGNLDENAANQPWHLAKSIDMGDNPKWNLDFNSPVKLFGNTTITYDMIRTALKGQVLSNGDGLILVWWFTDYSDDCLSNGEQIIAGKTEPNILPGLEDGLNDLTKYAGYYPAYVMRVVYNGKNVTIGR